MVFKESNEEFVRRLKTNSVNGLTQQEAKNRLDLHGYNEFEGQKKETLFQKSLHHITEITSIILMIAAAISGYVAITQGTGWPKVIVILSIVIINVVVAVYQESKSEAALEALKRLNTNTTTVIRDGKNPESTPTNWYLETLLNLTLVILLLQIVNYCELIPFK